jgi:hypothetical protein
MNLQTFRGFQQELSAAGIRSTEDYFDAVADAADLVAIFIKMPFPPRSLVTRLVPEASNRRWACLAWPASAATWRARTAYWSATLSVNLPARILNFWRAVEAATTKTQRYEIFRNLKNAKALPVRTHVRRFGNKPGKGTTESRRNATVDLKQRALKRRQHLINLHGGEDAALDWLYFERCGKAAHADKSSLDFEGLSSFGDQVADAALFQYMARVAIERNWS